jgi:hypothetical protein
VSTPEMEYVSSTSVEAIGYDAGSQELHVRFLSSGETYVYTGVPDWVFEELRTSSSMGNFVNTTLKNAYSYYKL